MSYQEAFLGYYFKPTIMFKEADFFGIFCFDFAAQLRELHQNLEVEDEDGITRNFREMPYVDFCILIYQQRQDLIDFSQN